MDLSLIICTWNNSKRLEITLDSIARCKIPVGLNWELVLVNNNCTDNTDEVVKKFSGKLPLLYVYEPRQGLSRAKNAGLRASSGKLILFTDDDVKPCRGWIDTYWNAYQSNPDGYYWGGPIVSEFEVPPKDMELIDFAPFSVKGQSFGSTSRVLDFGQYFVSANWACPSVVLKRFGGFNAQLGLNPAIGKVRVGEETELQQRLCEAGYRPYYLSNAIIQHFVPRDKSSLKHIASRVRAYGLYCGEKDFDKLNVGRRVFGVPLWIYKEILRNFYYFICCLLVYKVDYKSYLKIHKLLGYMKAINQCRANQKNLI